jgi:UDP-N-acetylglucosamine--N-acetylmuramyl-(pentapeptide) pyrophosphoryl-undecaprenol N-acetylglucosamine transferase
VCRAGAGTVSELAAAGRPAILIPFPFSADDHQARNAEAVVEAGAGIMFRDRDFSGQVLFEALRNFIADPSSLKAMAARSESLRKAGAAARAADILLGIVKT